MRSRWQKKNVLATALGGSLGGRREMTADSQRHAGILSEKGVNCIPWDGG